MGAGGVFLMGMQSGVGTPIGLSFTFDIVEAVLRHTSLDGVSYLVLAIRQDISRFRIIMYPRIYFTLSNQPSYW
jgi:hypothetical protein